MKFLALALGSGVTVGILRATAQHYWTKHLNRKSN
jgi:hypothetical protein